MEQKGRRFYDFPLLVVVPTALGIRPGHAPSEFRDCPDDGAGDYYRNNYPNTIKQQIL